MERARTSVTNFFGRVPLSYTRFSLTQQMDGDASQVEMKLAADEEECGEQTVGGHVVKHRKGNNYKSLCFRILAITLLILIGFLVGYLCRRGREVPSQPEIKTNGETDSESLTIAQEDGETEPEKPSILYWGDLQPMLSQQIGNLFFEDSIRRFSGDSHEAGSFNDENNALFIHEEFSKMSLDKVWDDEHYVTLQSAGSSPNKVTIVKSDGTEEVINPPAYVAYSPSNYVTGSLVYCQYGRNEDFKNLQKENIDVAGRIVLVRSGIISISEKVTNAERSKAIGVLIYPDPLDFSFPSEQETILSAFGHAHFGTGDPYTPGFPSFNNTQFPPSKSSGLPQIPVQTISSETGKKLLERDVKSIKLEVTNVMRQKKLLNIFGVIKGFDEPDRYVVVGAQRDAWGPGAVKSAVGTSILLELARALSRMVASDGFRPRRSIVFASWSAGEFGAVGATEWQEGYLSTLHLKAFSYINLDGVVQGEGSFQVSASPLMFTIIEKTMQEVKDPLRMDNTIYNQVGADPSKGIDKIVVPFTMEDASYSFLAFSGIPSVSFSFMKDKKPYAYLGTTKDTLENLKGMVKDVNRVCRAAAEFAAQIVLRLTHEHKLPLDISQYSKTLLSIVIDLNKSAREIKGQGLALRWINSARGDFNRAADTLMQDFTQSDLEVETIRRTLNDRVIKVEHHLLSPYLSPKETPFRHVLYGSGEHTYPALLNHLSLLKSNASLFNKDLFQNQLAMFTWTLQGAANALAGEIWEIDNEF